MSSMFQLVPNSGQDSMEPKDTEILSPWKKYVGPIFAEVIILPYIFYTSSAS